MYPYPYPPGYYQVPPYPPPSYVPCVFCHSTVPSNAMANHLAQCPSARAALPPTVMSTPFGSTQSVQYRRVVRVEKKTVNESKLKPLPVTQAASRMSKSEDLLSFDGHGFGREKSCITDEQESRRYARPLPPVPVQQAYVQRTNCAPCERKAELSGPRMVNQRACCTPQSQPRSHERVALAPPNCPAVPSRQPAPPLRESVPPRQLPSRAPSRQPISQTTPVLPAQPGVTPAQPSPPHPQPSKAMPHVIQPSQQLRDPSKPASGCVEQLNPAPLSDRIKQFEATTNPILPTPPPATAACASDAVRGEVEVLQPPSMSERKALFEKTMGCGTAPRDAPASARVTPPSAEKHSGSGSASQPRKLSIPPPAEGQMSLTEMLEKRAVNSTQQPTRVNNPPQPRKLSIPPPAEGQMSLTEMLEKRAVNSIQQPTRVNNPPQPRKLSIPPPAEGQMSLTEMLEKRAVTQSSVVTMKETRQLSVTQQSASMPPAPTKGVESPRSPQVFVENDTVEVLPEQEANPLFTANGVFLAELRKEEVKLAFSSEDPLPFNGYTNVVMCIYPDQICFYLYDSINGRYDYIKNVPRSSCVNTRLDRVLSLTNTLLYGILIMDKSQE